jgi:tetratricopeptide (TPR) repeat protein
MKRVRRYAAIGLVVTALGLGVYQSQTWEGNFLARGLRNAGLKPMFIPQGIPDGATEDLIEWFRNNTAEDEAVLAEFPVSTALLAYAGRPVVLHALFEGVNRYRFREFSFALIGDEKQLYDLMKKYKARYFVYSAHFLLRTDNNMSYRYTADAMKIDKGWTLYKMHFHPERLKRFVLIYQNSAFRVFRLVEQGGRAIPEHKRYEPVFDESLLAGLNFKTPDGVTKEEAFLYTIVSAYSDLRRGRRLMGNGERKEGLRLLKRSLDTFPFIPETHTALADYYRSKGEPEKAVDHLKKAHALDAGNWRQAI